MAATDKRLALQHLLLERARLAAALLEVEIAPAGEWELERLLAAAVRRHGESWLANRRRLLEVESSVEEFVEAMADAARQARIPVLGPETVRAARSDARISRFWT
jgi:hypothetical protein